MREICTGHHGVEDRPGFFNVLVSQHQPMLRLIGIHFNLGSDGFDARWQVLRLLFSESATPTQLSTRTKSWLTSGCAALGWTVAAHRPRSSIPSELPSKKFCTAPTGISVFTAAVCEWRSPRRTVHQCPPLARLHRARANVLRGLCRGPAAMSSTLSWLSRRLCNRLR